MGWRWDRADNESKAKDDLRIKTNIPIWRDQYPNSIKWECSKREKVEVCHKTIVFPFNCKYAHRTVFPGSVVSSVGDWALQWYPDEDFSLGWCALKLLSKASSLVFFFFCFSRLWGLQSSFKEALVRFKLSSNKWGLFSVLRSTSSHLLRDFAGSKSFVYL